YATSARPVRRLTVAEGTVGSHVVEVVGEPAPLIDGKVPCGTTAQRGISTVSLDYYRSNLEQAQWALNLQTATPTDALIQAIGRGIGNSAAHETAHQFGVPDGSVVGT